MISVLVGAAIGFGTVVALAFWDELIDWLRNFILRLRDIFLTMASSMAHAAAVFLQDIRDGRVAVEHKLYYKENDQYIEKTTQRTIPKDQVPQWALNKLHGSEQVDATRDFEAELQMKIS